jgi:Ran GTPase-activating protein (RanGAP) involved in mRNA processing and transport
MLTSAMEAAVPPTLDQLPNEILAKIGSAMDLRSRARFATASKQLSNLGQPILSLGKHCGISGKDVGDHGDIVLRYAFGEHCCSTLRSLWSSLQSIELVTEQAVESSSQCGLPFALEQPDSRRAQLMKMGGKSSPWQSFRRSVKNMRNGLFESFRRKRSKSDLDANLAAAKRLKPKRPLIIWRLADDNDMDLSVMGRLLKKMHVDKLYIHSKEFTSDSGAILAESLYFSPYLRFLSLNQCSIPEEQLNAILDNLSNARVEDLEFAQIRMNQDSFQRVVNLARLSWVKRLNLAGTLLMEGTARLLGPVLPKSNLHELSLRMCAMDDDDLKTLFENISQSKLEVLDLSYAEISEDATIALAEHIPNWPIRELNLARSNFNHASSHIFFEALKNTRIKVLNLDDSESIASGLPALVKSLPYTDIEVLLLNRIGASASVSRRIFRVLPKTKIRVLHLDDSDIDDEAAGILAQNLPQSQIEDLSIANAPFQKTGLEVIVKSLESTRVQRLTLCGKRNDPESVEKLVSLIPRLNLTYLRLDGHKMSISAVEKLANAIQQKSVGMDYLGLWDCGLQEDQFQQLADALPNARIRELNLGGNRITDEGFATILKSLQRSAALRYLSIGDSNLLPNRLSAAMQTKAQRIMEQDERLFISFPAQE